MEIESIRVFVKVVQLGSFSKAALFLKLPKSTISRTIAKLEAEAGTKLLRRTTRSMTLTPSGQSFYERCVTPVSDLEEARKILHGQDSLIQGHIRLTAPEDLGGEFISIAIAAINKEHKGLTFELNFTDEIVDLIKEGFDIAVRVGKLKPSRYKARLLGNIRMVLVASPGYLKGKTDLKRPQDLELVDCLNFTGTFQDKWTLLKGASQVTVKIKPKIVANQMTTLLKLVQHGAGVALLPYAQCRKDLESGALVRVLSQWEGKGYPVSLVTPPGSSESARIKLVNDYLFKTIKNSL